MCLKLAKIPGTEQGLQNIFFLDLSVNFLLFHDVQHFVITILFCAPGTSDPAHSWSDISPASNPICSAYIFEFQQFMLKMFSFIINSASHGCLPSPFMSFFIVLNEIAGFYILSLELSIPRCDPDLIKQRNLLAAQPWEHTKHVQLFVLNFLLDVEISEDQN